MNIELNRYYQKGRLVKSTLVINHVPFCEAREIAERSGLEPGDYRCLCMASELSAMTLRVCRQRGRRRIIFGWDLFRQAVPDMICIGAANPDVLPEERVLTDQLRTFRTFTQMLYKAYGEGEDFSLVVKNT